MLVLELATRNPASIHPDDNVAQAASLMWERDCGILPVVDDGQKVIGMLTDRDICFALTTRNRLPSTLSVREVMSHGMHGVMPTDSLSHALKVMRKERIRRVPVVDAQGRLEGMLSLNDIILAAGEIRAEKLPTPGYEEVMLTLKTISAHGAAASRSAAQPVMV